MRKVVVTLVVLVLLAIVYVVIDVVARLGVQSALANQVQSEFPNAKVTVKIHSFPFLLRLATSGKVPEVSVQVSGGQYQKIYFQQINAVVHNLKIDHSDLFHGKIKIDSMGSGQVSSSISQWQVSRLVGAKIRLRPGTIGSGKVSHPVSFTVNGSSVMALVPDFPKISFSIPVLDVLPCLGQVPAGYGSLNTSCQLHQLPPFLRGQSYSI